MHTSKGIELLGCDFEAKGNKMRIYNRFNKKRNLIKAKINSFIDQVRKIQVSIKYHKRDMTLKQIIEINKAFKRNLDNVFEEATAFNSLYQNKEKEKISLIKWFCLNERVCFSKAQVNLILAKKIVQSLASTNSFDSIKESYLNKIDLNDYRKIRSYIENLLTEEIKDNLYNIVLESKISDSISIAASNSITLLNKSGFSFKNKDLSNIKIPNADLSWGLFINTNFESSFLDGVNFSRAHIYNSDFRNCSMLNVNFGKVDLGFGIKTRIIKFSPCGRFLAIAKGSKIFLYDAKTYEKITQLIKSDTDINFLLFSDDGKYLVSSDYEKRILWDTSTKLQIGKFSNTGTFCCFSPCNNYLCLIWQSTGTKTIVKIYSIKTKKIINEIRWLDPNLWFASFTPSGENLIIWNDNNLSIWNLSRRTEIIHFDGLDHRKVGISLNRKYIAIPTGKKDLALYDFEKLEPLVIFTNHFYIKFSHCGRYIAIETDWIEKVINLSKGKEYSPLFRKDILDFHPKGKYLLANDSFWSPQNWKIQFNEEVNKKSFWREQIWKFFFSIDSQLFVVLSCKGWISIFLTENQKILKRFMACCSNCNYSIAIYDTFLASTSCQSMIKFWNIYDGSLFKVIKTNAIPKRIEFSSDGKKMLSLGDFSWVEIWDIDSNQIISVLKPKLKDSTNCCWSKFGNFVISLDNKYIRTWDVKSQKQLARSKIDDSYKFIRQSPCGKFLLCCEWECKKINIWYLGDIKRITKVKEILHDYDLYSIVWSPDSKSIIAGSDNGKIIEWDYDTGKVIKTIAVQDNREIIENIKISKMGHFFTVGGYEQNIKIWKFDNIIR